MSNKASTVGSVVNVIGIVAVCVVLGAFIQGGSKDFWYMLLAGAIGLLVFCVGGYVFFGPVKNKQKLLEYKQRHEKMKAVIAECMNSSSAAEPPPKRRYSPSSVELVRQAERETLRQRRQGEKTVPPEERDERSSSRQARSPNTNQATRPPRPNEQGKAVRPRKDATTSRSRKPKDEHSLPLFSENEPSPAREDLVTARKDLVIDEFFL
ncbi:hypothetical protein A9R05_41600 (plasmid) [Burkholderia sp. KK1]|uniref:Transmembrane protein n=1 Tax=Burkholderia sp. M701 TaxID=326454 RepID=V5YPD6_9BURK|nr:hypothetical protein [Burkholderia sp. M701]AQH05526.1 hypothetical protein A9R05_41600 [Burkholderia sp. KK1]BAO18796.1 hypothetical protein [Burkholderia sp. M701]